MKKTFILILCLISAIDVLFAYDQFVDPNPSNGNGFGTQVVVLSNGNVVISSPKADINGVIDCGAVYLFNGTSGELISSLVGSNASDSVGYNGITALSNGNYVVSNPNWNGNKGAVTWGDGTKGVTGTINSSNSLVGSMVNDYVGSNGLTALSNGNYVVSSPKWNVTKGAVTWGDGTKGVTGTINSSNSLVGTMVLDKIGNSIRALINGNFVVISPEWNNSRGAVTWGDGSKGVTGEISSYNSLIGSNAFDFVGSGKIKQLSNSNFVLISESWNGKRGAVSWGDGTKGVTGVVSSANSLIGSNADDFNYCKIFPLNNSNFVVCCLYWNGHRGAVTWGDGTKGITGIVNSSNSLVGTNAEDRVGSGSIIALCNGNYVVSSPHWNGNKGAVTLGSGTKGITGFVDITNSLVGSNTDDLLGIYSITALTNGNYVVCSPNWNGNKGAVTWGDGTKGIAGTIDSSNSLVGSDDNDIIGYLGSLALSNGNFVVLSPSWNNSKGAVTWGDGTKGVTGTIDSSNSLVGSNTNDRIGYGISTALSNGNYVVSSPNWNGYKGAATWGDGSKGVTGFIDNTNSLVGSNTFDNVGEWVINLPNGNFIVYSSDRNRYRGAVTWGRGTTGVTGTVNSSNSLVGINTDDNIGYFNLIDLSNSNYIVISPDWNGRRGAATWGSGTKGVAGTIDSTNSIIGDEVNFNLNQVIPNNTTNEYYVSFTPHTYPGKVYRSSMNGPATSIIESFRAVSQTFNTEAFPNPFSSETILRLLNPENQEVTIELTNLTGNKTSSIYSGLLEKGIQDFKIDGSALSGGIYLYRVTGERYSQTGKLILNK